MCTLVLLARPGHDWPLILAANRDEDADRPAKPPAHHWPDRPDVVAGLDVQGGGSWLGLNDQGVVAGILNRRGTLGPAPGKRSRGELVLEALDFADAVDAAEALADLSAAAYRPFNLVIADTRDRYLIVNDGTRVMARPLPDGLSFITAFNPDDPDDPRAARNRPDFAAAPPPDPDRDDWSAWEALLARRPADDPYDGMCVGGDSGFGTRSGALIALPADGRFDQPPIFRFAAGPPDRTAYQPVRLVG